MRYQIYKYKSKRGKSYNYTYSLSLYIDGEYNRSLRLKGNEVTLPELEMLLKGFNLNAQEIYAQYTQTIDKCEWCGKSIKNKPFSRQKKYCSKECANKAYRENEYRNALKKRLKQKLERSTFAEQYTKNGNGLPNRFNQIDDPKKLGNTKLTKHLIVDEDFSKEEIAIKSEKKRLGLI